MHKVEKGLVLYDFVAVQGGAEKLTYTLLAHFPNADFCAAFINDDVAAALQCSVRRCFDLGAESNIPLWRILKVMWAFEHPQVTLEDYDWCLFSGVYAPFAVRRRAGRKKNLLYCHTPPRFCFDLREHYMRQIPWFARPVLALLIAVVKRKYKRALRQMDIVIANSENVRQRLHRYFSQEAVVVHPPVDTERFRWLSDGDYYLSLARLEDFKRVNVVVQAFRAMPERRLIVTSGGSELEPLKRLAAGCSNIQFTGWVSEEALCELVGHARAAVYVPMDEDFGMSPVEAMAAGKPVIGVAEGGLLETIVHGETGLLVEGALSVEGLCDAIEQLEALGPTRMRAACEARASLFSKERFVLQMKEILAAC
ncbi:glycosyl transferase family 1 [Lamprobacter modestohalophilus]|uniref:Glycosyl transferase family 1 n=1 Tax=Lamprobacter modestohalophilus TaxID=1064514 RepID=A0A9X0W7U0_9GAMM|nr:glycosyltransferase [Lamprobacter modestohalophilus]MBK1618550.1 glycosyl transferase family 1 [Lamprobacter modestohalophilus]